MSLHLSKRKLAMKTMSYVREIWNGIPYPIFVGFGKILSNVPMSWRLGKGVQERYNLLNMAENWDEEKIRNWQICALKKVVKNAKSECSWYKDKFAQYGIECHDIKCTEDFARLPTLKKSEVRENPEAFISRNADRRILRKILTGGSTGTPLVFYAGENRDDIETASLLYLIRKLGCNIGDKVVVLRMPARKVNPSNPFWTYYAHKKQLVMNAFLISDSSIENMVKRIEKFAPQYIMGPPNVMAFFSNLFLKAGLKFTISPQFVLLSSENTFKEQRKLISKVFNCKTIDLYGQTEQVSMAFELSEFGGYNVNPFYSFTEVIDEKGKILVEPGAVGEIVGTTYDNFTMPLIRYKTGDMARIGKEKSLWGQQGGLWERIEGRTVDVIQTLDGRWMNIHGLVFGRHEDTLGRVIRVQIEQRIPGYIIIRVIKGKGYSENDEINISRQLSDFTEGKLQAKFEYVDEIKLTEGGKHKFLIQHLQIPF
jgi:phenylacetate-coenzyme A ligase PaaK-like adenylate-forming protein